MARHKYTVFDSKALFFSGLTGRFFNMVAKVWRGLLPIQIGTFNFSFCVYHVRKLGDSFISINNMIFRCTYRQTLFFYAESCADARKIFRLGKFLNEYVKLQGAK